MKEQVNSAYDLSLFEAAPELEPKKHPKKNNVIVLPKEKIDNAHEEVEEQFRGNERRR